MTLTDTSERGREREEGERTTDGQTDKQRDRQTDRHTHTHTHTHTRRYIKKKGSTPVNLTFELENIVGFNDALYIISYFSKSFEVPQLPGVISHLSFS